MIEFIVAVNPRPNTKARHFVSVAQALDWRLVRPCCHARKRDSFSAHPEPQKSLIDSAYFDILPRRSPTFFREEPIKLLIIKVVPIFNRPFSQIAKDYIDLQKERV